MTLLCSVAACGKKETPAAPGAPTDQPGGAAAPAGAGKTAKLTCAKVAPSAKTWFPDATLDEKDACPNMPGRCGPSCMWHKSDGSSIKLGFQCSGSESAEGRKTAYDAVMARRKGSRDLPGVGAMALESEPNPNMKLVQAWDDDSRCMITVGANAGFNEKAIDLAKEALANVKAGDVD